MYIALHSFIYHSIIRFEITTRVLKYVYDLMNTLVSRRLKPTRISLLKMNNVFGIRTLKSIRLLFS